MEVFYETKNGKILHGDNIECLDSIEDSSVDSCISDFPYAIEFMGKSWDCDKNFYEWCHERAKSLVQVMKPGGYVAIFGYPKTNHRMKCALEDAGFKIVEEIDWIYSTGMPKNQDIGKLFDKAENKVLAKQYYGYKTAGLKPAHEPITIFQKPLEGTYIQNIEKYDCGAMNIDACRVPFQDEHDIQTAKAKTNFTEASDHSRGFGNGTDIYGDGNTPLEQAKCCIKDSGRFPPNVILDKHTAEILDEQIINGSRYFPIIKYCLKVAPHERRLPNGERNPHVTVKPVELIKWLIKLLTPKDGITIDITAGSCTHAVACEKLNYEQNYGLRWVDIELMNTESEPYCYVGKQRVENVNLGKVKKLF